MMTDNHINIQTVLPEAKRYVIGQDQALTELITSLDLSLALVNARANYNTLSLPRASALLLIGSTASGKTHMMRTICNLSNIKIFIIDTSTLSREGWKGSNISDIMSQVCIWQKDHANTPYILFWDEFDKISGKKHDQSQSGGALNNLLKILEEENAYEHHDQETHIIVDMKPCIHVLAGAFTGIEDITKKRIGAEPRAGFTQIIQDTDTETIRKQTTHEDLIEYGLPPEIIGRISCIINIPALTENSLSQILATSENNIISQFSKLMPAHTQLKINTKATSYIVKKAIKSGLGARYLTQSISPIAAQARNLLLCSSENTAIITVKDDALTLIATTQEIPTTQKVVQPKTRYKRNIKTDGYVATVAQKYANGTILEIELEKKAQYLNQTLMWLSPVKTYVNIQLNAIVESIMEQMDIYHFDLYDENYNKQCTQETLLFLFFRMFYETNANYIIKYLTRYLKGGSKAIISTFYEPQNSSPVTIIDKIKLNDHNDNDTTQKEALLWFNIYNNYTEQQIKCAFSYADIMLQNIVYDNNILESFKKAFRPFDLVANENLIVNLQKLNQDPLHSFVSVIDEDSKEILAILNIYPNDNPNQCLALGLSINTTPYYQQTFYNEDPAMIAIKESIYQVATEKLSTVSCHEATKDGLLIIKLDDKFYKYLSTEVGKHILSNLNLNLVLYRCDCKRNTSGVGPKKIITDCSRQALSYLYVTDVPILVPNLQSFFDSPNSIEQKQYKLLQTARIFDIDNDEVFNDLGITKQALYDLTKSKINLSLPKHHLKNKPKAKLNETDK